MEIIRKKVNTKSFNIKMLKDVFSRKALRAKFINENNYLSNKEHINFCIEYTCGLLKSGNDSSAIEDMFLCLSDSEIYDNTIINNVLASKMKINYYAKLAILDYILENVKNINKDVYLMINRRFYEEKNFKIVKFQAYINLCIYEPDKHVDKILLILSNQIYPTFFYRLLSSLKLKLFRSDFRKFLFDEVKSILFKMKFDKKVELELLDIMKRVQ